MNKNEPMAREIGHLWHSVNRNGFLARQNLWWRSKWLEGNYPNNMKIKHKTQSQYPAR